MVDMLDLTEDQSAKIEKIRLDALKKTTELQNQIREKRAKLISLQTADNADMKAIDKLIDEIAALRTQIQKVNAKKHQDIRNLLTADQKVIFDKNFSSRGCGHGRAGKGNRGGGNGNYPNCYRR
jgi:Spy/CpxP family protein refolding chaperone